MGKKKVKLPTDRNGRGIDIGDWLMFSDGPFHVSVLNYYGKALEAVGCWTAEDEDGNLCDNLGAGEVISYGGES